MVPFRFMDSLNGLGRPLGLLSLSAPATIGSLENACLGPQWLRAVQKKEDFRWHGLDACALLPKFLP